MSLRPRIWAAPPGPVQSPGSTIRSSTRTPSEVVVPTCHEAHMKTWVIRRVTVLLPLVPVIDTTGSFRSLSRSHAGGVVPASSMRDVQRVSIRCCAPPRPLDDPVTRVAGAMDLDGTGLLAMIGTEPLQPGDERGDVVGPEAG